MSAQWWRCCCSAETLVGQITYHANSLNAHAYLTRIAAAYPNVTNTPISASPSGVDLSQYKMIVAYWPSTSYTTAEKAALKAWIKGGLHRRLILCGDSGATAGVTAMNGYINALASYIGIASRVSNAMILDDHDQYAHCSVNSLNYLQDGVQYLWDWAVCPIQGWETSGAVGLVDTRDTPPYGTNQWAVEELVDYPDTRTSGSVVIADSSMFIADFNDVHDTDHTRNFRWVYNLCTKVRGGVA